MTDASPSTKPLEHRTEDASFKLLFIVGSVRSGSTVLGNLLAELDGFVHVGELHNLWKNLLLDRACGCGLPLSACPVWSRVRHGTGSTVRDVEDVIRSQTRSLQARYLPALLWGRHHMARWRPLRTYRRALDEVYGSIARETAARVIIDSSKMPSHVAAGAFRSEAYLVHLVRDPRGVGYSRLGNETMRPELRAHASLRRLHLMRSSWQWAKVNAAAELVCGAHAQRRVLRVRYEDFALDPRGTVDSIANVLGEPSGRLSTFEDRQLAPNHTVGGNANRFQTGPVAIREDTRWFVALDRGDSVLTATAAAPLFNRYGYRIGPARGDSLVEEGRVSNGREDDEGGSR